MLKWFVCLVTELAFVISKPSEINRMLKCFRPHIFFGRASRIVDDRVADVAIIPDHFAGIANVLTVMTAETSRRIKMTDIIRMSLPIRFHLREKIRLEDALDLFDAGPNGFILAGINIYIVGSIELIQAG